MPLGKLKPESKSAHSAEEISAFLGKDTQFEGKITFLGIFRLDGKFEGEVFDSGTLIIGESAFVRGKIGVNSIIISGHVEGEIVAQQRVEIHSTGKFFGNIVTPILIISEGGFFEGHCKMVKREEKDLEDEIQLQSHPSDQTFSF